jgi:WD40 repeat protein
VTAVAITPDGRLVAISPNDRWVVTASLDDTTRLWDLNAKDPTVNPVVLQDHIATVDAVASEPGTGSGEW